MRKKGHQVKRRHGASSEETGLSHWRLSFYISSKETEISHWRQVNGRCSHRLMQFYKKTGNFYVAVNSRKHHDQHQQKPTSAWPSPSAKANSDIVLSLLKTVLLLAHPIPDQDPVVRKAGDPLCHRFHLTNPDLFSLFLTDASELCKETCYNTSQCASFVYFPPSHTCYLFSSCTWKLRNTTSTVAVQEMRSSFYESK